MDDTQTERERFHTAAVRLRKSGLKAAPVVADLLMRLPQHPKPDGWHPVLRGLFDDARKQSPSRDRSAISLRRAIMRLDHILRDVGLCAATSPRFAFPMRPVAPGDEYLIRLQDRPDPTGYMLRCLALDCLLDPGTSGQHPAAVAVLCAFSGLLWPEAKDLLGHVPQVHWNDDHGTSLAYPFLRHRIEGTEFAYHDLVLDDAALIGCLHLANRREPLVDPSAWLHRHGYDPSSLPDMAGAWLRDVAGRPDELVQHLDRSCPWLPLASASAPLNEWLQLVWPESNYVVRVPRHVVPTHEEHHARPAVNPLLEDVKIAITAIRANDDGMRTSGAKAAARRGALLATIQHQCAHLRVRLGVSPIATLEQILHHDEVSGASARPDFVVCANAVALLECVLWMARVEGRRTTVNTIRTHLSGMVFFLKACGDLPLRGWSIQSLQDAMNAADHADSTQQQRWRLAARVAVFLNEQGVRVPLWHAGRYGVLMREAEYLPGPAEIAALWRRLAAHRRANAPLMRSEDMLLLLILQFVYRLRISEALSRHCSHVDPSLGAIYVDKSDSKSQASSIRQQGVMLPGMEDLLSARLAACREESERTERDVSLFHCGDDPAVLAALGLAFNRQLARFGLHSHSLRKLGINVDTIYAIAVETGMSTSTLPPFAQAYTRGEGAICLATRRVDHASSETTRRDYIAASVFAQIRYLQQWTDEQVQQRWIKINDATALVAVTPTTLRRHVRSARICTRTVEGNMALSLLDLVALVRDGIFARVVRADRAQEFRVGDRDVSARPT